MSNGGTLPEDIVTDILSRLPVKSLCRFKCVSPSWNSLISDPHFAKTHLNRIRTQNPKDLGQKTSLIYASDNLYSINLADANPTATKLDFPMPELEQYHYDHQVMVYASHNLYSINLADENPTATKLDFPMLELEQYHNDHQVMVWSSCNGLLLVSYEDMFHPIIQLFLLNPANRECKKLPTVPFALLYPDSWYFASVCGVGYDPFTDDYKVVTLYFYNTEPISETGIYIVCVAVYSLKTNAWRRIQDSHNNYIGVTSCGLFFYGCIHCCCWRGGSFTIVAFDISDEIFREVPLPAWLNDFENDSYKWLDAIGDCLCLVFTQRSGQVEVWMMEEYGVRESWNRFISIDMPEMFSVQLLSLSGEVEYLLSVILGTDCTEKLVLYNPKNESIRDKVVRGLPTRFAFGINYVESLVSPYLGGEIGRQ